MRVDLMRKPHHGEILVRKRAALLCVTMILAAPVCAKNKVKPVPSESLDTFAGKTLALAPHTKQVGVLRMGDAAGIGIISQDEATQAVNRKVIKDLGVDGSKIIDPTAFVGEQLASMLAASRNMQKWDADGEQGVRQLPDYRLEVTTKEWLVLSHPLKWRHYWVRYHVEVKLYDSYSAALVSKASCDELSNKAPALPTLKQLYANDAKLLNDVSASLAWKCVRSLAAEQFRVPAAQIASTPADLVEPLANLPDDTDEEEGDSGARSAK
jgi:hypothetical protein